MHLEQDKSYCSCMLYAEEASCAIGRALLPGLHRAHHVPLAPLGARLQGGGHGFSPRAVQDFPREGSAWPQPAPLLPSPGLGGPVPSAAVTHSADIPSPPPGDSTAAPILVLFWPLSCPGTSPAHKTLNLGLWLLQINIAAW